MSNNFKVASNIVTCFGMGKIKYAPGTFGSLLAYPFIIAIFSLLIMISLVFSKFANFNFIISGLFLSTLILFVLGCKYSKIYADITKKDDPSEIVIDEVVGQVLILVLILPINKQILYSQNFQDIALYLLLSPFLLFRLFDIIKPWPINWFDRNIKGGFGIMLDDIIAALFATLTYYNIFYLIN